MDNSEEEEEEPGTEVTLHIYDVSHSEKVVKVNDILEKLGTGAFHAAVEVYGLEWSYGKAFGCGIFHNLPKTCKAHHYRESHPMGRTSLRETEVHDLLQDMHKDWPGASYDLLSHNCTHFSNALCERLGVGSIPSWVMNLGAAGAAVERGLVFFHKAVKAPLIIAKAKANEIDHEIRAIIDAGKMRRGANPWSSYHFGDFARGLVAAGQDRKGKAPGTRGTVGDAVVGVATVVQADRRAPPSLHPAVIHVPAPAGLIGKYGNLPGKTASEVSLIQGTPVPPVPVL